MKCHSIPGVSVVTRRLWIHPVSRFWCSLRGPSSVCGFRGSFWCSDICRGSFIWNVTLYVPIRVCFPVTNNKDYAVFHLKRKKNTKKKNNSKLDMCL